MSCFECFCVLRISSNLFYVVKGHPGFRNRFCKYLSNEIKPSMKDIPEGISNGHLVGFLAERSKSFPSLVSAKEFIQEHLPEGNTWINFETFSSPQPSKAI